MSGNWGCDEIVELLYPQPSPRMCRCGSPASALYMLFGLRICYVCARAETRMAANERKGRTLANVRR